jgi:hypothetical protein
VENNIICTTALKWQPEGNRRVERQKNNLEKDGRDRKRRTSDEQLSKDKDSS